ncbi:MAG: valine--tRNA ligase [Candidatus Symbiobacter sp.]|nr:valine--tRNA ligase [Candidatus Symbiobacter sp.]
MDKNIAELESRLVKDWEQSGLQNISNNATHQTPYSIMMPPPNVTGSLHIGHALNFTLQDILVRYHRAQGKNVLWQPGTDHAGIATQMVVERQLTEQGTTRQAIGRDEFIKKTWAWKEESGGTITRQLRRLGATPDWSRERFTFDEGLSRAVTAAFVQLYNDKLIYRAKRLINWDPKFQTAVSDLEVVTREIKGQLCYLKYPIENSDEFIIIATTRPETMLADGGVAVHPDNERWRHLIGKYVTLPLVGRRIPIIADEYADPTKGSGAVKITAAHDFNDFLVAARHNLPIINLFTPSAHMNENAPAAYRGLDRIAARKKVLADLEALGLVDKIEPHTHAVPHGDRSGEVIEPYLTDQWFVDAKKLAAPAIAAVDGGHTKFIPAQWKNTWDEWMHNIQPWCISRQIWWGHRIPAWYAPANAQNPDGRIYVAASEAEAMALAANHYPAGVVLRQDDDVLDTWFSSALWPFSTLGWPDQTPELARFYPTNVLVTGFDIIFFWVARMMMMGIYFMGRERQVDFTQTDLIKINYKEIVPFKEVYIHALVRDAKGQKMSKSKGNVINPLDLIDEFGADALRMSLASLAVPGRDVKIGADRVEPWRNFATKIRNVSRFGEMNLCKYDAGFDPTAVTLPINQWILTQLAEVEENLKSALSAYRFDLAAMGLRAFMVGQFCDWYVELVKPILLGGVAGDKSETQACFAYVLRQSLALLHPFMPFVTEEIWHFPQYSDKSGKYLAANLLVDSILPKEKNVAEIDKLIDIIERTRELRGVQKIAANAEIIIEIDSDRFAPSDLQKFYDHYHQSLFNLTKAQLKIGFSNRSFLRKNYQPGEYAIDFMIDWNGHVDAASQKSNLAKELIGLQAELEKIGKKLGNEDFIAKADPEVVEENKTRQRNFSEKIAFYQQQIEQLNP